jgi:hypothetical protein
VEEEAEAKKEVEEAKVEDLLVEEIPSEANLIEAKKEFTTTKAKAKNHPDTELQKEQIRIKSLKLLMCCSKEAFF